MIAATMRRLIATALALGVSTGHAGGGIVVIGNSSVPGIDPVTLQKIYTGRVVELNGVAITAVNSNSAALRSRFLQAYLSEDDGSYTAYWIKRRYAGRGVPPRELSSASAVVNFVKATPGAIGYVEESEVEPGVTVLLR